MGIIDKNTVTLRCPKCQIAETLTAVENGSVYGSSGWRDFKESTHFDFTSVDRGSAGPQIESGKCKKCAGNAVLESVS